MSLDPNKQRAINTYLNFLMCKTVNITFLESFSLRLLDIFLFLTQYLFDTFIYLLIITGRCGWWNCAEVSWIHFMTCTWREMCPRHHGNLEICPRRRHGAIPAAINKCCCSEPWQYQHASGLPGGLYELIDENIKGNIKTVIWGQKNALKPTQAVYIHLKFF